MEKLPDLKELPENMLEIKEDRSEISLQDLIDNFYTQSLQDDSSEQTSIFKFTFKANTIMGKVSKETRREQRYNANLHNLFVKAQEEIANEQYRRNLCPSHQKDTGTLFRT